MCCQKVDLQCLGMRSFSDTHSPFASKIPIRETYGVLFTASKIRIGLLRVFESESGRLWLLALERRRFSRRKIVRHTVSLSDLFFFSLLYNIIPYRSIYLWKSVVNLDNLVLAWYYKTTSQWESLCCSKNCSHLAYVSSNSVQACWMR